MIYILTMERVHNFSKFKYFTLREEKGKFAMNNIHFR